MRATASLKAVGNWSQKIEVPLHNAMMATVEMMGRTGRQACEQAIVLMAQSAGSARQNLTRTAPANRKVVRDEQGEYVERYYPNGETRRDYRWMFTPEAKRDLRTRQGIADWDQAKRISARGLARRSWMWGVKDLIRASTRPIAGVADLAEIEGTEECGLVLTNRLSYLDKVTDPSLESRVAQLATNKIMAQVAKRAERRFGIVVNRLEESRVKKAQARLDREFRRARGAGRTAA